MARNKLENNIKTKLDERSIKPSSDAWNTLSERLDNFDKKKDHKSIWYIGIAASVVGILFLANVMFNNSSISDNNEPQVVDTQINIEDTNNQEETTFDKPLVEKTNEISNKTNVASETRSENINTNIIRNPEKTYQKNNTETIAQINSEKQLINNRKEEFPSNVNATIENKESTNSVIAQVENINTIKASNIDTEIEQLLVQAQENVTSLNKKKSIDANSLLQDVEDDLDRSFRDKVFETLKSNIKQAATAVAERNN